MKKYLIQLGMIFFLVIIGVGIVSDINVTQNKNELVSSYEEKIENGEIIEDGNLGDITIRNEDTSNRISRVAGFFANIIVKGMNACLRLIINLMNGLSN